MELYERIGKRIRGHRRSKGILQEGLAESAGLSRGSISNIEAGRQKLYIHHLVAIAKALQLDPAELLAPAPEGTPHEILEAVRRGKPEKSD